MKKHRYIIMTGLLVLLSTTACNHSDNSNVNQESFSQFTNDTFTVSADETPVEVEDKNLRFDIENNESVFDQLVMDNEFAV